MNKDSVTTKLRNRSKETGVHFNILLTQFFFDEFLKQLASSEFKGYFTLKGGVLLSNLLGLSTRATMDIDFLMRGMQMDLQVLNQAIEAIISENDRSGLWFEFAREGEPIRDQDEYGGFRFFLIGHLSNIRVPFSVDIATGDPVVPEIKESAYTTVFGEIIKLNVYPLETVLAEKIQTILYRAEANGRSKDFYDIHIIWKLKSAEIDVSALRAAFDATFRYRNTAFDTNEADRILQIIENDHGCLSRWSNFKKKNPYVGELELADAVAACREIIRLVDMKR